MNMYQKMSNYTTNEYNAYSKDTWSTYDQMSYSTTYGSYFTTQNDVKRFKLNQFNQSNSFIDEYDYWNGQQQQQQPLQTQKQTQTNRSNLHCDTTRITTTPSKQTTSPANRSISSTESDHLSLCESLHKAYQAGHLTKTRYRRLIANERERNRMHGLNIAFENLRSVLPSLGSSKQFSKYETLQMATNYINALREIILNDDLNSKKF